MRDQRRSFEFNFNINSLSSSQSQQYSYILCDNRIYNFQLSFLWKGRFFFGEKNSKKVIYDFEIAA